MRMKKQKETARTDQNYTEGNISITSKLIGYVRTKDSKDSIEIEPAYLNTALHGDIVKVLIHQDKKGLSAQSGEVVEIIRRSKAGFAGILEQENEIYFLAPSDHKMYTDIVIPENRLYGAKVGQKVFGIITAWHDSKKAPLGEIIEILGNPKDNDVEMRAIALEKGFNAKFPEDVENEAQNELKKSQDKNLQEKEITNRRDFRGVTTFTIDPIDAKDFDDALSVKKLADGDFEIGIHIADVSHYVRPDTLLDKEAVKRATSVYLVDRTIPMLPEILSNDLCSLVQGKDRLTMSAVFVFDKKGNIKSEWFGKTIINSNKRFTYEEAQNVLDLQNGPHLEELNTLYNISKELTKKRFEHGAISLDQDEVKFKLDEKGIPTGVYIKTRLETSKLIEEFMLIANKKVAEYIGTPENKENKNRVFVYRVHNEPEESKIQDLVRFLAKLGYKVKTVDGLIPPSEINNLLKKLDGKEEKKTVQTAIIRSMAKAIYSTKNIGHYGLAFEFYTHFTSPIRRYPDVIVHRLLNDYLHNKVIKTEKWHEYDEISIHSSIREKEASDAERTSIKYKQIEYMSYHIGENFDGVITGVTEWGMFVEEKETKCEGMIRLKDIGDDYYEYQEKEMAIVGKKTKKKYRIGDQIKIKVKSADLNKMVIDYVFV